MSDRADCAGTAAGRSLGAPTRQKHTRQRAPAAPATAPHFRPGNQAAVPTPPQTCALDAKVRMCASGWRAREERRARGRRRFGNARPCPSLRPQRGKTPRAAHAGGSSPRLTLHARGASLAARPGAASAHAGRRLAPTRVQVPHPLPRPHPAPRLPHPHPAHACARALNRTS